MLTATTATDKATNNQANTTFSTVDSTDYLKKPSISDLNRNYFDADGVDQDIFAEMRSNILLAAGDHYNRRASRFYKRIRDSRELSNEQKLRLTKNHTQKICKTYANNILSANPGIGFSPKDEKNPHDQKVAQIHHSVWRDAYERYYLQDKMDDWADSFCTIGEVAVKLFWDETLGDMKGYEPQIDQETQSEVMDEFGQPLPDETKPVFSGEFVWEEIYGFNLLRPSECKDMRKAEWLGIRKMMDRDELLRKFKNNEKLMSYIRSDADDTYVVFDPLNGGYKKSNKQTMIREYYYRPSLLFPKGYFYITTKEGILAEGELPGGLFPIVFATFDKYPTTPRGRSIVKTIRPYQAEINRAASKMAEHQITLGDDKLLIQNGTKVSAGSSLPGIRSVNYTGEKPTILGGRDGSQYLNYMQAQIQELYQVCMVAEDSAEEKDNKLDPYVLLFRSAKQKKKFQRYIGRFEKFLIELCKLYIDLAKIHFPDDMYIMAAGKNEQINIEEFRQYPSTCYEVKIEAQSDDIETKLGKQIVLNHTLQYVGSQLSRDDIGKMMTQMPFANFGESFSDFTMDADVALNDILQLDRGERPPINQYDNHVYMIKRLSQRTRKADFKFLPPVVQKNYMDKIAMHQQFEAKNAEAIQRAEQGFIPTDGALISVDFYVNAPNTKGGVKQQKAKIPYFAIDWLLKQMEAQGKSQEALMSMTQGNQAQIADMVTNGGMVPPQAEQGPQEPSFAMN